MAYTKQFVRSKAPIFSKTLKNFGDINSSMLSIIDELEKTEKSNISNVRAWHTHGYIHKDFEEFAPLLDKCIEFIHQVNNQEYLLPRAALDYECANMWGMKYKPGDDATPHNHFPADWVFVYYLDVVPGQSPLVIENLEYFPKNNELIMFHGIIDHYVPKVTTPRTAISMNFMHTGFKQQ